MWSSKRRNAQYVFFHKKEAHDWWLVICSIACGEQNGIMPAMKHITTIALDADDTLWGNEDIFVSAQQRYMELLAPYRADWDAQELYDTEQRNLAYFGYGIKGFTLSMIETAIQITDGKVSGHDIGHIIAIAREMVHAPIALLPTVAETVAHWSTQYRLMVITKGDLFDQESKVARSGLADYFRHVEVVSEKHPASYERILIVSEGSKTEPNYFREIRTAYRLHTANVEVHPSELGTAPIQVVQYARSLFESGDRHKQIQPRAFEQVYAVFDRDDQPAISMPCSWPTRSTASCAMTTGRPCASRRSPRCRASSSGCCCTSRTYGLPSSVTRSCAAFACICPATKKGQGRSLPSRATGWVWQRSGPKPWSPGSVPTTHRALTRALEVWWGC